MGLSEVQRRYDEVNGDAAWLRVRERGNKHAQKNCQSGDKGRCWILSANIIRGLERARSCCAGLWGIWRRKYWLVNLISLTVPFSPDDPFPYIIKESESSKMRELSAF
jgi:hypothetical protein